MTEHIELPTDPRMDPVGTVRTREGRTAVKVAMGDTSGKGGHVWVGIVNDERRWYHHGDVRSWTVEAGDSTADEATLLRDSLSRLVALKDGPRDASYKQAKDAAWMNARSVLSAPASSVRDTAETAGGAA